MAEGVSRRTLLLSGGGLAAVLAGGVVAVSIARREPSGPPIRTRALPTDDLGDAWVAEGPVPEEGPVEIVYCAGWDATAKRPVSPMSEATARAQDAAGAQYAVVLLVNGAVRAVVEVCWSAHHAELWNVDDTGRRYRGVAYRRWPDGRLRLFEVRSWDYPEPGTPEFDGGEPSFRARVRRDDHAALGQVDVFGPRDGLRAVREWSTWPEPRRPTEHMAVPAVSDWARVVGMTGDATVRSGPGIVPDRFPWRPPRPLQPLYVTEMVTDGMRFTTEDGTVHTIERVDARTIRLPTGRLVVADPGWLDADAAPYAETVPPGEYPVDVFRLGVGQNVACRISVTGATVASWHLAILDGNSALALGEGEFNSNPVDTATLGIVDAAGASGYSSDEIETAMERISVVDYRTISDEKSGTDLVIVAGWTDGGYPVWIGRTDAGVIASVVVDFMSPDLRDATPA